MWMSFAGIRINKWEDNKMETMDDYKDELEASFRRINEETSFPVQSLM